MAHGYAPALLHERDAQMPAPIRYGPDGLNLKQLARDAGLRVWEPEELLTKYNRFFGEEFAYRSTVVTLAQAEVHLKETFTQVGFIKKRPVLDSRQVWLDAPLLLLSGDDSIQVGWKLVVQPADDGFRCEFQPTNVLIKGHPVPNDFGNLKAAIVHSLGISPVEFRPSGHIRLLSGPVWIRSSSGFVEHRQDSFYALDSEVGLTIVPEDALQQLAEQPMAEAERLRSARFEAAAELPAEASPAD